MYNYQGLLRLLQEHNLHKSHLTQLLHMSSRTIAKFLKVKDFHPQSYASYVSTFLVPQQISTH